jgi:hypothetical protein
MATEDTTPRGGDIHEVGAGTPPRLSDKALDDLMGRAAHAYRLSEVGTFAEFIQARAHLLARLDPETALVLCNEARGCRRAHAVVVARLRERLKDWASGGRNATPDDADELLAVS